MEKTSTNDCSRFGILAEQIEEVVAAQSKEGNSEDQASESPKVMPTAKSSHQPIEVRISVEQPKGRHGNEFNKVRVAASNASLLAKITPTEGSTSTARSGNHAKKEGASGASVHGPLRDITNEVGQRPNGGSDATLTLPTDISMDGRPPETQPNADIRPNEGWPGPNVHVGSVNGRPPESHSHLDRDAALAQKSKDSRSNEERGGGANGERMEVDRPNAGEASSQRL